MTKSTRLSILKTGYQIENLEARPIDYYDDEILEKYALFILDKMVDNYAKELENLTIIQKEITTYRNKLYSFTDESFYLEDTEISGALQQIKQQIINNEKACHISISKNKIEYDEDFFSYFTTEFVSNWIMPKLLMFVCESFINLSIEGELGSQFIETIVTCFYEYGIECIIDNNKSAKKSYAKIIYKNQVLISEENFIDGAEFEVVIQKALVEGIDFILESEERSELLVIYFPVLKKGDIVHCKLDYKNEYASIEATNLTCGITVKKMIWG